LDTVIVIGGGAAGILAAGAAGSRGKKVILLEKNNKLGKKIFITGKGRCNLTNDGSIEELLDHVVSNRNFLYSAFYSFSNTDIRELMHQFGVETKVERGNRVFPISDKSSDVIKALTNYINDNNVDLRLEKEVKDIIATNEGIVGVKLKDGSIIECNKVIVATGGMSYPTTGSTGDGYRFAKSFGHRITPLKPGLVPLETQEEWVKELQGLSLKNVKLTAIVHDKIIYEEFGEMLFTHYGISGPIVLTMSNYINKYLDRGPIKVLINLKPALNEDMIDKRLQREFDSNINKQFKNSLNDLLPKKLISVVIALSAIPENKYVNQITKEERKKLIDTLLGFPITVTRTRQLSEAIVTAGGISTKEINPSTMESKIIEGLHFAGEIIDVDALTGGYNLQIAFSTGYLAGISV